MKSYNCDITTVTRNAGYTGVLTVGQGGRRCTCQWSVIKLYYLTIISEYRHVDIETSYPSMFKWVLGDCKHYLCVTVVNKSHKQINVVT